ncbi:MAG: T9SS type A sorting domain-containing protein, partial [Bacteroidales bacterium]
YGGNDTIINCEIKYNGIGLYDKSAFTTNFITRNVIENNNIGIKLEFSDNIFCNKICNNTTYDLYYNTTGNANISNNYWCTTDSAIIASHIYDGYDNISLGLVNFMPIDTIGCYLATGITEAVSSTENNIQIFPNPASNYLTIEIPCLAGRQAQKSEIKILNIEGQVLKSMNTEEVHATLDISGFARGMYFIKVKTEKGVAVKKFVKE